MMSTHLSKPLIGLLIALATLPTTLTAASPVESQDQLTRNRILYLMQTGDTKTALKLYQRHYEQQKRHDRELLQQIALVLLDQGYRSSDPEVQLLTYFGAGISANEKVLYIIEEGVKSTNPQVQLICLNLLMQTRDDHAEQALLQAMASPLLIIRMECAYHLCQLKMPMALAQTEALMNKVPKELQCLFPQYFAMIGDERANRILRRFFASPDEKVRIEAIRAVSRYRRDELLPSIRTLATHHSAAQLEACASALGAMNDKTSLPRLQNLANSPYHNVKLASLYALYRMGQRDLRSDIERIAREGNPYAITLLGECPGSEETLWACAQMPNHQIQANAALALLERRDPRCVTILCKMLIPDARDLALVKVPSKGKTLTAWRVVSSARENLEKEEIDYEEALAYREEILNKAINLPEEQFLAMAQLLFEKGQNDLIPILVDLLENMQSPQSIALLKQYQQKAGAPLIRNYCNLALYRLHEEGPYGEILQKWVLTQQHNDFIRFKAIKPRELDSVGGSYQLTPQETSRLLIESFETLSQNQEEEGIHVLLEAIKSGNEINKYALAGLLIRAST